MLRPADLAAAGVQRVATTIPVWTTESRTGAARFDPVAGTQIEGNVSFDSRGLSVEEHTIRVLRHLTAERDATSV